MAGARALWKANGMTNEQMGKPLIAIVNSFTQFVPGHVHLHEIGQKVKAEIEKLEKLVKLGKKDVLRKNAKEIKYLLEEEICNRYYF